MPRILEGSASCPSRPKLAYHINTIWLFTRSDLKTIVFPSTIFAASVALSSLEPTNPPSLDNTPVGVARLSSTIFWLWINLLPFTMSNQRRPESVLEDQANKPWRPLPSNRMAPRTVFGLMWACYLLAVLFSIRLGGLLQCVSLVALGYWYNCMSGGDNNFIVRNLINSLGYMCFLTGALEVVLQTPIALFQPQTRSWVLVLGTVVFTTIQSQDMADQEGDQKMFRRTMPLVLGDGPARWTIAMFVAGWSCICPIFLRVSVPGCILLILLGWFVSGRFLFRRSITADEKSFLVYNIWIMTLFCLPLLMGPGVGSRKLYEFSVSDDQFNPQKGTYRAGISRNTSKNAIFFQAARHVFARA